MFNLLHHRVVLYIMLGQHLNATDRPQEKKKSTRFEYQWEKKKTKKKNKTFLQGTLELWLFI